MRSKKLLAAFLLGIVLSFVPVLGYGKVMNWLLEHEAFKPSNIDFRFLNARINYMMANPRNFLYISFYHDKLGDFEVIGVLPKGIHTRGKIIVKIKDNRGVFSHKSRRALLNEFKKQLKTVYRYIEEQNIATDMNNDIIAQFYSREELLPLGYFYEGQYYLHLWEEKQ